MKIERTTAELTSENVESYLTATHNVANLRAANRALSELAKLFAELRPADLLRHAIAESDGGGWLTALADQAQATRSNLSAERRRSDALLKDDAVNRHVLDMAAVELMIQAEQEATHKLAAATAADAGSAESRASLAAAGLSGVEIARIVAEREADGEPLATQARDAAAAATQRAATLAAFLKDPLRRVEPLGKALELELIERRSGMALRTSMHADIACQMAVACAAKFPRCDLQASA